MRKFVDYELQRLNWLSLIHEENERQIQKWGVQDPTLPEWLMYLTEEIGELNQASAEFMYRGGSAEDVAKEAIQSATLALKIAETVLMDAKKRGFLSDSLKEREQ